MLHEFDAPVRQRKAPQEIVHRIREHILSGHLPRGSKLPTEHDLTTQLNVSRQTLREALRVLEVQGLLEIRAGLGGGAFVAEVDTVTAHMGLVNFLHSKDLTLEHLTDIRRLIEPHFAAEAVHKITPEQLEELEELQLQAKSELAKAKSVRLHDLEMAFHHRLASIAGNPLLLLMEDFIEYLLRHAKATLQPDKNFSNAVVAAHDEIVTALRQRDEVAAVRAVTADIDAVGSSLQKLANGRAPLNWQRIVK